MDSKWGTVSLRPALWRVTNHGIIRPAPLKSLAAILSGALTEACMLVANAEDPDAARAEAIGVIERLLRGLQSPQGHTDRRRHRRTRRDRAQR